jgi:hypothetical protein
MSVEHAVEESSLNNLRFSQFHNTHKAFDYDKAGSLSSSSVFHSYSFQFYVQLSSRVSKIDSESLNNLKTTHL